MAYVNVMFSLSMPGCNSWNGKWSGAGKAYYVKKKMTESKFKS